MPRCRAAVASAVLVVVLDVVGSSAAAQQSGPVSISVSGGPGEVRLAPGGHGQTSFVVRNPAAYAQSIEIETTGLRVEGGSYQFDGQPPPGVTVEVVPTQFSLPGGASQDVAVVVRAARTARPGGAYAGILVRGVPDAPPGAGPVVGEIGVPLFALVEGEGAHDDSGRIVSLAVRGRAVEARPLRFRLTFENSGEVHYPVRGRLVLRRGGRTVGAIALDERLVLPGTTRTLEAVSADGFPAGRLSAHAEVTWGAAGQHRGTAEVPVDVTPRDGGSEEHDDLGLWPWLALALLLAAILALLLLLFLRRRRRRRDD